MGIPLCCEKPSDQAASSFYQQSRSRKDLLTFVQSQAFFSSGMSSDINVNLLGVGTEPMEIIENTMKAHKVSSGKKSLPKKLTFEDFLVIRKLGEGGFGKVFLVQRKDTEKLYAMKILKKSKLDHVYHRMHTISERQILQNVNSPFVVKLHCAFQNSKNLYLVLEYLSGGSLFELLSKQKSLTEDSVRFYAAEITLALEDLHCRNIVYRDLKPENILVDLNGHIKLTDFGLSKQGVISGTKAYTTCGTAEYLAPEMLLGKGHDHAVDWWSLGCILYQMLVGALPHSSSTGNKHKLFEKIRNNPVEIPDFISKEGQAFLKGLLEIDPNKRLKDITQIKQHSFFAGIDWDKVREKQLDPPKYEHLIKTPENPEASEDSELNSTLLVGSKSESPNLFAGFTYYNSFSNLSDINDF